ncbi:MAG: SUMF1/EgtB/PvdO family nonheme iron enzyme [Planctomycetia bacterium]|nr:SUMF1/EgtB/PvdO family nonheme iron enzyme [Planctomycetia bacterium]
MRFTELNRINTWRHIFACLVTSALFFTFFVSLCHAASPFLGETGSLDASWRVFLVSSDTSPFEEGGKAQLASNDVVALAQSFLDLGVPGDDITVVSSKSVNSCQNIGAPTKENIESAFETFCDSLHQSDDVFVYFSGYGVQTTETFESFFIPDDVQVGDLTELRATSVSLNEAISRLIATPARLKWFALDVCRENKTIELSESDQEQLVGSFFIDDDDWPEEFVYLQGCDKNQVAIEWNAQGHSLFALALLAALQSDNNPINLKDEPVTLGRILNYVSNETLELAQKYSRAERRPVHNLQPYFRFERGIDRTLLHEFTVDGWSRDDRELLDFFEKDALELLKQGQVDKVNDVFEGVTNPDIKETEAYRHVSVELERAKAHAAVDTVRNQRRERAQRAYDNTRQALKNDDLLVAREQIALAVKDAPEKTEYRQLQNDVDQRVARARSDAYKSAVQAYREQDYDQAERYNRIALSYTPNDETLLNLKDRIAKGRAKAQKEAEENDKALVDKRREAEEECYLARTKLSREDYQGARELVETAVVNFPEDEKYAALLDEIVTRQEEAVQSEYQQALIAFESGDLTGAEERLARALTISPEDQDSLSLKKRIAKARGVEEPSAPEQESEPKPTVRQRPPRQRGASYSGNAGDLMIKTIAGVDVKFRWCPPGEFLMGSPQEEEERSPNETLHRVVLTRGFWLAETETTQALWNAVMGGNASTIRDPKFPVDSVSWYDCRKFIDIINSRSEFDEPGYIYALPTEAQWEYACRAGTQTPFSFGAEFDSAKANSNGLIPYGNKTKTRSVGRATEVGSYPANRWGLVDMHGNVWEWTNDWYEYNYYQTKDAAKDPTGPSSGSNRVLRGGGWLNFAKNSRSANRYSSNPSYSGVRFGFRLALVDDATVAQ